MKLKKITLLFGRICSGKSSYKPKEYRIVVSNIVKGIISKSTREELQNTIHLDEKIGEALVMVIDRVAEDVESVIVDGIRQVSIVKMILQHYPDAELIWLEVPVEERKRRYESRKDIKDVEPFDIADNKPIELLCQDIFTIFKEELKVINNYMELLKKANGNIPRTEEEKARMIEQAAEYYGQFLTALGFDWKADPHSDRTPHRVAKAWVKDLIAGSMAEEPEVTAFPNDEQYTGLICQTRIPVMSLCAHHNLTFSGVAHVAYIPGKEKDDLVIGLSKLNRIVDFYSRRPNIQESLTKQIHDHIARLCVGNRGVAVVVESQHNCVRCRGIKQDSVMKTSQMSGYFWTNEVGTRQEFFNLIDQSRY